MDIAVKKIELIEWLAQLQDEEMIKKVEALRTEEAYETRIPRTMYDLQENLDRSQEDIEAGRVHAQEAVEAYFKNKFKR